MCLVGTECGMIVCHPRSILWETIHLLGRHIDVFQTAIFEKSARILTISVGVRHIHFISQ